MAIDYTDLDAVQNDLKASQNADEDIRDQVREAHHFIDKRDGQWEPDVINQFHAGGKPRYTFDKTNPVVDQISGEMENADFTLKIRPMGGQASKDTAKTIEGLIRNIRNISNSDQVFNAAGRSMVTGGMDGWEVVQEHVDGDSFDQDLMIRKIHNWVDRVWFDSGSEEQDHSDANHVYVLQTMLRHDFEDAYPGKATQSVDDDRQTTVYFDKPDFIVVGRILYKKPETIELVRMNNGAVYRIDEKYESVKDELAEAGIVPEVDAEGNEKRRKRKSHRVHSRLFSGKEWLNEEQETVFNLLPVCATYGNFKISENKRIVRGIVESLMDQQRVYNYGGSEQVRQTALAPVQKIFMTKEQAKGNKKLATMNQNTDPVQTYTHQDMQPQPYQMPAPAANPALQTIMERASADLNASAGLFASNMADNPGLQSGVAIDRQIQKGDNGTTKWFSAQEIAICYTGKVLIDGALARTYDASRQVRILGEDGSMDMVQLNQTIFDEESRTEVILNDLSVGEYDVVCTMGPAFSSRMRETTAAFAEMAAIDPSIMETGRDVWLANQDAPGMDIIAERTRINMVMANQIPEEQLTDEEKQMVQQAQQAAQGQPQQPDAMMVAAQAEQTKAQADVLNAQNNQTSLQIDAEKVRQSGVKLEMDAEQNKMDFQLKMADSNTKATNTQADTLNKLIAAARDGILTPELSQILDQQVREIGEEQAVQ